MEQKTINNGDEFVIETKTDLTDDSVYFTDEGTHIKMEIENCGGEDAAFIIYKESARELCAWLIKHI